MVIERTKGTLVYPLAVICIKIFWNIFPRFYFFSRYQFYTHQRLGGRIKAGTACNALLSARTIGGIFLSDNALLSAVRGSCTEALAGLF